jgi:hypothetical protein
LPLTSATATSVRDDGIGAPAFQRPLPCASVAAAISVAPSSSVAVKVPGLAMSFSVRVVGGLRADNPLALYNLKL